MLDVMESWSAYASKICDHSLLKQRSEPITVILSCCGSHKNMNVVKEACTTNEHSKEVRGK